jgi:hypothetical protein
MNVTRLASLFALLILAATAYAQGGNDRGTAEVTVKGTKISINYGRPELKGRDVAAQAPVGMVWRLGKNQATEITTTGALDVAGKTLPAGKYSLWAKKVSDTEWSLGFHPKTGVWGVPELKEGYVAELPLKVSTAPEPAELMTIALKDAGGKAQVDITWGKMVLSGEMGVK